MASHLGNEADRRSLLQRVAALDASSRARWGRMSVAQMICHLNDSFRVGLGEKQVSPATGLLQRTALKWIALQAPVRWAKGFPTRPEIEQGVGGTKPSDFERDRAELLGLIERFAASAPDFKMHPHPVFGPLNAGEWLRWGYLHTDHHLRQFGV